MNDKEFNEWALKNFKLPAIKVRHKRLKRYNKESLYKSKCPKCKEGVLLMRRNLSGRLLRNDNCINCGRRFIYIDLKETGLK
jgi:ssDNA-binding Zn-finger/Zn-ribbon topoisomerase 1